MPGRLLQFATMAFAPALLLAPIAAHAQVPEVRSNLPGSRIVATAPLPAPARAQALGGFCSSLRRAPGTAAGRHAAALSWVVTSEQSLAGYTAVGIFSRGDDATSGTCLVQDGNIVLYRDDRPLAIVYEPPRDGDESGAIGGVVATFSPDRLRISDFSPAGFESTDLLLGSGRVAVVPIAAMETACGGVAVPNMRGKTVPDARALLAPHGWRPDGRPDPAIGDLDAATGLRGRA